MKESSTAGEQNVWQQCPFCGSYGGIHSPGCPSLKVHPIDVNVRWDTNLFPIPTLAGDRETRIKELGELLRTLFDLDDYVEDAIDAEMGTLDAVRDCIMDAIDSKLHQILDAAKTSVCPAGHQHNMYKDEDGKCVSCGRND